MRGTLADFIYLFITEMVFRSSWELESDVNFFSLLENLGFALGAFKGVNLSRVFLRTILFIISVKKK